MSGGALAQLAQDDVRAAGTSAATGRRGRRRADIQGLRAVAVLFVVIFHAGLPLPGGFTGVDVFFVISGFVISSMLLRELGESDWLNFKSFYTRRMRRILPALALCTAAVAVLGALLLSPLGPQSSTSRTGVAASLFTANFELGRVATGYFDLASSTNALLHTWSLSVEEQFYLMFPLLLLVAWRIGSRLGNGSLRRKTTFTFVAIATLLSFGCCVFLTYHPSSRLGVPFAFYSPFTRAWEFGVGVLLALAVPRLERMNAKLGLATGVAGAALIVLAGVAISDTTAFPGYAALLPVLGAALVIAAGTSATGGVTAALGWKPAVYIGDVSYGWYLWHWPLIVFAAAMWPDRTAPMVVAAFASLIPTALSYRLLENPIRFNERIRGWRVIGMVAVCILVPILAYGALTLAGKVERKTSTYKTLAAAAKDHEDHTLECDGDTPVGQTSPKCTWTVPDPKGTIVLVGDSNAGQFTEPIVTAANEAGYDLTAATHAACPFADLVYKGGWRRDHDNGPDCLKFVEASLAALKQERPSLVILSSSASQWVNNEGQLRDPHTGETADTPEGRQVIWERGLHSVVQQLSDAGIPTLVVQSIPHFSSISENWAVATCPVLGVVVDSCGDSISRSGLDQQQQRASDANAQAIDGVASATSIDFTDVLCPSSVCTTFRDGLWYYRDATHLSVHGAQTLTDEFKQVIVDHAAS